MKHLIIDKTMKEIWPDTRVGCLQYRVKVEKKNEELWKYLKKDIFKRREMLFLTTGSMNPKRERIQGSIQSIRKGSEQIPCVFRGTDPSDRTGKGTI